MFFLRLPATALTKSSRSSMTSHMSAALRRLPRSNSSCAFESESAVMPFVGLNRWRMLSDTLSGVRRFSWGSFIRISPQRHRDTERKHFDEILGDGRKVGNFEIL